MGVGEVIKNSLEFLVPGWSFMALDARGPFGGLVTTWCVPLVHVDSLWGCDSGLGLEIFSNKFGGSFTLVNVYGPYLDRFQF